jgi:prolipoprotein diacylglyceryltransferase
MHSVLLRWHGVRIHSYPAFLHVGMVLELIAGNHAANVSGLDSVRVFVATLMLGAVSSWNERPFPGAIFPAAVTAYACGRSILEPTREHRDRIGALDVQRALAAAVGPVALAGLLIVWLVSGPSS